MPSGPAKDKHISFLIPASEHRVIRQKSLDFEISISELIRYALTDEEVWKKAAKAKQKGAMKEQK